MNVNLERLMIVCVWVIFRYVAVVMSLLLLTCSGSDLDALMAFKRFAQGPSVIADVVFSSAGRFVVRDQGPGE